jgi:hypothetical protein
MGGSAESGHNRGLVTVLFEAALGLGGPFNMKVVSVDFTEGYWQNHSSIQIL